MQSENAPEDLLNFIVDRVNTGIFAIDPDMNVLLWNTFMASHSERPAEDIVGRNLFDCFPELPKRWLQKKIESVFILKNFAFISWEQRPYLFKFSHNRPVTGGIEYMSQNFTLMPIKNDQDEVTAVCLTLQDATDVSIYQTMLDEAMTKLEHVSRTDGLTELNNRHHWEERLSEEFNRMQRCEGSLALVLFDLDHFKSINDNHGHLAGDLVLKEVGRTIKESCREYDVAGRYGGEEFGLFLPSTDIESAKTVAERIRTNIQNCTINFEGTTIPVTASLGISMYHDDMKNHESLLLEADSALYVSKENGRNQWTIFAEGMENH